jgi:hypothetical protein
VQHKKAAMALTSYRLATKVDTATLQRTEFNQATRHLNHACELLVREAVGPTVAACDVLQLIVERLSRANLLVRDVAAELALLRQVAQQVAVVDARGEILKAIALLRDKNYRW